MLNLNNIKTPGVYIDEVDAFPPSVAAVATGIPAFVGYTERAQNDAGNSLTGVPTKIFSPLDYEVFFGGPQPENDGLSITITDTIAEDTAAAPVVNQIIEATISEADRTKHNMYYALQLYFANGGGPCYIVSVGGYSPDGAGIAALTLQGGVSALEPVDEPTMIVIPEIIHLPLADYATTYKLALDQANKLKDRFVILDMLQGAVNSDVGVNADITAFRSAANNIGDNVRFGAAYYPYLNTTIDYNYLGFETTVTISHDRVLEDGTPASDPNGAHEGTSLDALNVADNLLYVQAKQALTQIPLSLPPSSAMAAIYAKVDAERGVFKAPANVAVGAVVEPARKINNTLQDSMNIDASGRSINAIRTQTGRGIVVWGARTLDGNSNDWKYISTRRFFNFVEESVKKASYRFVFEPNDANTWVRVKAMVENFLTLQWSQGALQGAKPEQAFYVKVGLGQTMTAQDILSGRMIVEIGMAVVRPAEFIILRFTQMQPEA